MGIGRPLTPTALCAAAARECYCYSVLGMQDLLLALLSKRCRSVCVYGGYYFYRVTCVELQADSDDLPPKTAETEE
jgi:hypothetical protein